MPEGSWSSQAALDTPLFGAAARLPPSNPQAEQALLGAILANNKAYHLVSEFLRDDHFFDPIHAKIYERASARIDRGQLADAVTLKAEFLEAGILQKVGGTAYLTQLLTAMVGILNAADYGRAVYDCWQRRSFIEIGQAMVANAYDFEKNLPNLAVESATAIDGLVVSHSVHPPTALSDAMGAAIEAGSLAARGIGLSGVRSGLPNLDEIWGDLEATGVYVVAARPGGGKSALALQIGIHNAEREVPVKYFSTEMRSLQLGRRALSHQTGIPTSLIKRGVFNEFDDRRLKQAWADQTKVKRYFDIEDVPGLNMRVIAARSRSFARKFIATQTEPAKIGLVVIDHIHDLEEMSESEMKAAIGKIMRGAKKIAKDLGWPVLVLAQMNRNADGRENKRPEMSDLYGGMQIEAAAEGILLLERPDRALDPLEPERKPGEMDEQYHKRLTAWQDQWNRLRGLIRGHLPKNRDEASGQVLEWDFDGARNKFTEREVRA